MLQVRGIGGQFGDSSVYSAGWQIDRLFSSAGNIVVTALLIGLLVEPALAHEAYVLPKDEWRSALAAPYFSNLAVLWQPEQIATTVMFALAALVGLTAGLYFWRQPVGERLNGWLLKWQPLAHLVLRTLLGLSLIIGVSNGQIFGPELAFGQSLLAISGRWLIGGIGVLILVGWLTEIAAAALMISYAIALAIFGGYLLTYLSIPFLGYALTLIGAGPLSVDLWLEKRQFWPAVKLSSNLFSRVALVNRLALGGALLVGALTIKIAHPAVALAVVNRYGLTDLPLMPTDPLYFVALAAVTEVAIGLLIIVGLQTRLVAMAALGMFIAAQIFFAEPFWAHLPLLGLAIYLIISGSGRHSCDAIFEEADRSGKGSN